MIHRPGETPQHCLCSPCILNEGRKPAEGRRLDTGEPGKEMEGRRRRTTAEGRPKGSQGGGRPDHTLDRGREGDRPGDGRQRSKPVEARGRDERVIGGRGPPEEAKFQLRGVQAGGTRIWRTPVKKHQSHNPPDFFPFLRIQEPQG